ncbi:hypothetical protein D3C86_1548100 [compost metagenome]
MKQAIELLTIGVGATGDFPDLTLDAGGQTSDVFQVLTGVLDLLDAVIQVAG